MDISFTVVITLSGIWMLNHSAVYLKLMKYCMSNIYTWHAGRGKGNTKFVDEEEICYQLWPVTGSKRGAIAAVCLLWTAVIPVFSPHMRNNSSANILGFRREYDQMTLIIMRGIYVSFGWGYQLIPNKIKDSEEAEAHKEWSPLDISHGPSRSTLHTSLPCSVMEADLYGWYWQTHLPSAFWLTWPMGGTSRYQRV